MSRKVQKATEIKNAKISFVSLVDKAANKRQFLITKADDGKADWKTVGRILKAEDHYVTGVVYEPLVEDSQGDFMTADEIQKACYWFAKNGDAVDIQHNDKAQEGISVVENWVAKADFDIDGETIQKGTWLLTAEVSDSDIWDKIQKGEITGFSMGGVGEYSKEDTDLSEVTKQEKESGVLDAIKSLLGIQKSETKDKYEKYTKENAFWTAFEALRDTLGKYNWNTYEMEYATDTDVIRENLEDFNKIITDLLVDNEVNITKSLIKSMPAEIKKAGKKMSGKNKETLVGIYDTLGEFIKEFDEPDEKDSDNDTSTDDNDGKEETQVTKEETIKLISEEIAKAMSGKANNKPANTTVEKSEVTAEFIAETVRNEIAKAVGTAEPAPVEKSDTALTADAVKQIIADEIAKAVEPIRKAAGVPSNLNDSQVAKQDENHYMHGFL